MQKNRITILSGENVSGIGQEIYNGLINTGRDIKHISLENTDIKPCYACRSCETKTYLRCIVRDNADIILPYLAQSGTIIIVTQIVYGSYSLQVKRVLDKIALLIDTHYGFKNGELIKGAKPAGVQFYAVGVHHHASGEEIAAFQYLINELIKIANWDGKPIVVPIGSPDINSIIKEIGYE